MSLLLGIDIGTSSVKAVLFDPDTVGIVAVAQRYTALAGTMPATGFMAPTLLWLRHHEPALLDQIRQVILPKDYVRLKMTGRVASDPSDAAATGLFDVSAKDWSAEIIEAAGL